MTELEAEARAINATDWQPLPRMVKKRCAKCCYFFAAKAEMTATCPDCAPAPAQKRSNNSKT